MTSGASGDVLGWPTCERPRERLQNRGASALSSRELLAVLIGSGGPAGSAVQIADGLIAACSGSLRRLSAMSVGRLRSLAGIGRAKAALIQAAFELGRRAAAEELDPQPRIHGPQDVHALMGPRLRDLSQEEFHVLLLNVQHRLLHDVLITRGILDASLIHPREVLRPAIVESAAALILVHNHPSGDPTPSPEDRAVTRQLAAAGRTVGIPVLDHVIVGDGSYVSLSEQGGIPPV